jgi:hypothetical protein
MNVSSDTYANLPAITWPMPAVSLPTPHRRSDTSILGESAGFNEPGVNSGQPWTTWGAARDGARRTITGYQQLFVGLLCITLVAGAFLLPDEFLLAPIAFITFTYLVAGAYKAVILVRGDGAHDAVAVDAYAIADEELPIYTVLAPLFREGDDP